jgi:hypothetical protein
MELVIQQKKNAREKSRRDVVDWLRFQKERLYRLHRPDRIAATRRKLFNPLAEEEAVEMNETRAD